MAGRGGEMRNAMLFVLLLSACVDVERQEAVDDAEFGGADGFADGSPDSEPEPFSENYCVNDPGFGSFGEEVFIQIFQDCWAFWEKFNLNTTEKVGQTLLCAKDETDDKVDGLCVICFREYLFCWNDFCPKEREDEELPGFFYEVSEEERQHCLEAYCLPEFFECSGLEAAEPPSDE